jgi:hypothetical protein
MKNTFRLPRKIKKYLKKEMWFYPLKDNCYVMAWPSDNQKEYNDYKTGLIKESDKI